MLIEILIIQMFMIIGLLLIQINRKEITQKINTKISENKLFYYFTNLIKKENNKNDEDEEEDSYNVFNLESSEDWEDKPSNLIFKKMKFYFWKIFKIRKKSVKYRMLSDIINSRKLKTDNNKKIPSYKNNIINNSNNELIIRKNNNFLKNNYFEKVIKMKLHYKIKKLERKIRKKRPNFKLFEIIETSENILI